MSKHQAAPVRRSSQLTAVAFGLVCHCSFAIAIATMIVVMFSGMNLAQGRVAAPWRYLTNGLLLLQFVFTHSVLLTRRGSRAMRRMAPRSSASQLSTTTYAIVASVQVFMLFAFWTPSGVTWWRAHGVLFYVLTALNAVSWLFLLKAIVDAGFAMQVGLLGWWAVARGRNPVYPPMPVRGLFRWIRQPIYLGFAMTLWTVPVWTPDQLAVAIVLSFYCFGGPVLKEARFKARFGEAFGNYQASTPYWLPWRLRAPK